MSKYIHFTDEQKIRANNVDLVDFLRSQGEEVIRSGHEYRWKRHDSVTISGNRWFRHSAEEGGLAINFVQTFYNISFPDAVTMLMGGERGAEFCQTGSIRQTDQKQERPRKPFALPLAHDNNRREYAYLTKQRCIDPNVISHFVRTKTLYEDSAYHNAVFVGLDENGVPRHAHKKSTLTIGRSPSGSQSFRANVESSNSRYGFCHIGHSNRLYVFEAPIDLLSFITLYKKDWQEHSYLTLNGVSEHALLQTLDTYPRLRTPVLCLDNDPAGIAAINRITDKLKQMGYDDTSHLPSACKDWNEQLQQECGMVQHVQEPRFAIGLSP